MSRKLTQEELERWAESSTSSLDFPDDSDADPDYANNDFSSESSDEEDIPTRQSGHGQKNNTASVSLASDNVSDQIDMDQFHEEDSAGLQMDVEPLQEAEDQGVSRPVIPSLVSEMEPIRPCDITWGSITTPPPPVNFHPASSVGIKPQIQEMKNMSPLHFYNQFVNDQVLELIVRETNKYAEKKIQQKPQLRKTWTNTDVDEVKKYIGFLFWMGLCKYPKVNQYWSKHPLYKNEVSKLISRQRFELLTMMLHFADDDERRPNDKLYKVSKMFDILICTFKDAVVPGKDFCIDETNVPWRGRLSFRQYLPNKRHKYGIKVFKLCLQSGFTWNFSVYTGRDINRDVNTTKADDVVLQLSEELLDQGRCLYVDNWYTSVTLATKLQSRDTHLVGTLRGNRKYNSKKVVETKLKKGETVAEQSSNKITMMKWRDQRDVLMLSTCHTAEMVDVEKRTGTVSKPCMVVEYNKCKSFIDISDQMTAYAPALRRTLKWYKRLAFEILTGTCTVNAMVLYNSIHADKKLSITDFRTKIAEELLYPPTYNVSTPPRVATSHKLEQVPGPSRTVRRQCKFCYQRMSQEHNRAYARKHPNRVTTKCNACDVFTCLKCFNENHAN